MEDNRPRGVRNNNPGNLIRGAAQDRWQGVSAVQADPKFWNFDDAIYGIRAIARQLIAYQDKHSCKTVSDSIGRYAPPTDDNPTTAYALNVAMHMGITLAAEVNWHDYTYLRPAVEAIIMQENGADWKTWYTDAQLVKACILAGVEPKKRSLLASGQVIGGAIAASATVAGPVIQSAQAQLQPLTDYSPYIKSAFIGLTLLGVIITIITKYNERKKGIS